MTITISSKGQVAIPSTVRTALNLGEGMKLRVTVRGSDIVLSPEKDWRSLRGMAASRPDLMEKFEAGRKAERLRENARS